MIYRFIQRFIQRLKDFFRGTSPLFGGISRSREWPRVRKEWLKENPNCAVCNGTKKCEVHHKQSFHLHPEKELLKSNFITLCEAKKYGITCHLFAGHNGNYKLENPLILEDVKFLSDKLKRNE
jgi:hypothetical protein